MRGGNLREEQLGQGGCCPIWMAYGPALECRCGISGTVLAQEGKGHREMRLVTESTGKMRIRRDSGEED